MVVQFSTFAAFARAEPTNSIKIGHNFPQRGTVIPFIYGVNVCQCCQCTMFWQWYIYLDDRRKFLWFYVWFSCRKSADVKMRMRQGCQIDTFCRKIQYFKRTPVVRTKSSKLCHDNPSSCTLAVRHGTLRHGHSEDSERIGEVMGTHLLSWHVMTHFHSFSIPSTLLETTTGITCRSRARSGSRRWRLTWIGQVHHLLPGRVGSPCGILRTSKMIFGNIHPEFENAMKMLWTWYYFPWTGNQCNRWPTLNSGLDLIRLLTIHLMQESAQLKQQIKWDSTMIKSDLTPVNPISSYIYSYS